jgi:hypothetical protein
MWREVRVSVGNHRQHSAIAWALGFRRDEWIIASPRCFNISSISLNNISSISLNV